MTGSISGTESGRSGYPGRTAREIVEWSHPDGRFTTEITDTATDRFTTEITDTATDRFTTEITEVAENGPGRIMRSFAKGGHRHEVRFPGLEEPTTREELLQAKDIRSRCPRR